MDKQTARAVGLALAVYALNKIWVPRAVGDLYNMADLFTDYILEGKWPKKVVEQIGKQNEATDAPNEG